MSMKNQKSEVKNSDSRLLIKSKLTCHKWCNDDNVEASISHNDDNEEMYDSLLSFFVVLPQKCSHFGQATCQPKEEREIPWLWTSLKELSEKKDKKNLRVHRPGWVNEWRLSSTVTKEEEQSTNERKTTRSTLSLDSNAHIHEGQHQMSFMTKFLWSSVWLNTCW